LNNLSIRRSESGPGRPLSAIERPPLLRELADRPGRVHPDLAASLNNCRSGARSRDRPCPQRIERPRLLPGARRIRPPRSPRPRASLNNLSIRRSEVATGPAPSAHRRGRTCAGSSPEPTRPRSPPTSHVVNNLSNRRAKSATAPGAQSHRTGRRLLPGAREANRPRSPRPRQSLNNLSNRRAESATAPALSAIEQAAAPTGARRSQPAAFTADSPVFEQPVEPARKSATAPARSGHRTARSYGSSPRPTGRVHRDSPCR